MFAYLQTITLTQGSVSLPTRFMLDLQLWTPHEGRFLLRRNDSVRGSFVNRCNDRKFTAMYSTTFCLAFSTSLVLVTLTQGSVSLCSRREGGFDLISLNEGRSFPGIPGFRKTWSGKIMHKPVSVTLTLGSVSLPPRFELDF